MNTNSIEFESKLREIAARASFIHERRAPEFARDLTDEKKIDAQLNAWVQAVSEYGDHAMLERLWEWDGIDSSAARAMVAPVTLQSDAPLPRWAQIFHELYENAAPPELPEGVLIEAEPLPFQEILLPLVAYAQRAFAASKGYDLLAPQAQAQLLRALLKTLARVTAEPLFLEFRALRNRQPFGGLTTLVAKSGQAPKDILYQKFVAQMQQGGFFRILEKYPVLARLLGTSIESNIETQRRFLKRLADDTDEITRVFNNSAPLGLVSSLALSLSNPHHGGESVTAVAFASGLHLVYKPRDLSTELAFNDLLRWLNARSGLLEFLPLTVLNCETHGWVTFAEETACADAHAISHFYQRFGMLLALLYALEATDRTFANLVASGEYPVLIDLQSLFHPRVRDDTTDEPRENEIQKQADELANSVLRIGLLPGWTLNKDKHVVYDASNLGGNGGQHPRVIHANTDAMELKPETTIPPTTPNLPELNNAPAQPEDNMSEIILGFRAQYEFLLRERDTLLAKDSPFGAFKGAPVRFVFRTPHVYASLLRQAQQPAYLREGAAYSISLERLARAFLQIEHKPTLYPLLNAERHDLAQLDTPFFIVRTDSADLGLTPSPERDNDALAQITNCFTRPAFELVRERIQSLSQADLAWQIGLIKSAMQLRRAKEKAAAVRATDTNTVPSLGAKVADDADTVDLVAAAVALGEELYANVTSGEDGSIRWLEPSYELQSRGLELSITGVSTYNGLTGIALFSAALAQVTGDAKWRDLTASCFKTIREKFAQEFEPTIRALGIGGASGIGSIVYAMTRSGMLLDDSDLIADALAAIRKLTPAHIEQDEAYDVIAGSAGAILSLLAVYESTGERAALERAQDAARHLLATREPAPNGMRVWRGMMSRPLTGFSHGAAGISLALFRLYRHTHDEEIRAAAIEAIEFENTEFDSAAGNWYDLRDQVNGEPYDPEQPKYGVAWCHGAPGIGLARLGGLDTFDNAQVRADIETALLTTQDAVSHLAEYSDHLCCGNVGRIEFLWTASNALERPELKTQALALAQDIVRNAKHLGGYRFSTVLPRGAFAPGLFVGAAGIGYEFLRFAAPTKLPNVLLWE